MFLMVSTQFVCSLDADLHTLQDAKNKLVIKINEEKRRLRSNQLESVSIKEQIASVQGEIDLLNLAIMGLKAEIRKMTAEKTRLENRISENVNILRECIAAMYRAENPDIIDIILSARSLSEFLDKATLAGFFSRKVSSIVGDINKSLAEVESMKAETEMKLAEITSKKEKISKKREKLDLFLEQNAKIAKDLHKELDEDDAEFKQYEEAIAKYIREHAGDGSNIKFLWPVPGFRYISSDFNDIVGRGSMHRAIDIAGRGIYGAKIIAPAAGKVISVTNGWGGGFGNSVAIYHANGMVTRLAHMSIVTVKLGQLVKSGEKVGYVGNSGHSTGPHLHWEVIQNNKKINPISLLAT